jgi:hypothetical protein
MLVFVAIAAIAVAVIGAFAFGSVPAVAQATMSTTSTPSSIPGGANSVSGQGETFLVRIVNGPAMTPIAGVPVSAGPASSPEDIVDTPGGPTLGECVDQVPNGSTIASGGVISNGTTTALPSCPLSGYTTNATGWVEIANATGGYYFIKAGNVNEWNDVLLGVIANTTLTLSIPLPSGNASVPDGQSCIMGNGSNITSTCVQDRTPILWPATTKVLSCGEGVPSGSAVTGEGLYGGYYIAYAFANAPNGTKYAFDTSGCVIGSLYSAPETVVSGAIIVPNGTGDGSLEITVKNQDNSAITSITVAVDAADSGVTVNDGGVIYSPGSPPFSMYSGYLPAPLTSNLGIQISGATAGRTYTFTVTCTFSDESTSTQTFSLTAQD